MEWVLGCFTVCGPAVGGGLSETGGVRGNCVCGWHTSMSTSRSAVRRVPPKQADWQHRNKRWDYEDKKDPRIWQEAASSSADGIHDEIDFVRRQQQQEMETQNSDLLAEH